ncbi:hypothetical protein GH733_016271 [Mirounga leonina]|nr:hypothetical protein GH733_016271 [Mirounga leonina]
MIILANTTNTELKDLPKRIPKDSARYHFFLYEHSHEGDYLESISSALQGETETFTDTSTHTDPLMSYRRSRPCQSKGRAHTP